MSSGDYFRPARPVRAYEAIVQQFDEAIRSGVLRPGDRLPSEREMVKQFEVGRSTVREALRVLQSDGLIRSKPGDPRGPEVIAFSTELLNRPMQALLHSNQVSLHELIFFRMMTEGTIVASAADAATEDDLERLASTVAAMRGAANIGDLAAFLAADTAYHDALALAAHQPYLVMQNEVVRTAARSYLAANFETPVQRADYMRTAILTHEELANFVRTGERKAAATASHSNILYHYAPHLSDSEHRNLRAFYLETESTT